MKNCVNRFRRLLLWVFVLFLYSVAVYMLLTTTLELSDVFAWCVGAFTALVLFLDQRG